MIGKPSADGSRLLCFCLIVLMKGRHEMLMELSCCVAEA